MEKESTASPAKIANQLNKIADTFHTVHGGNRFPIDVDQLAFGCADIFHWEDPITKIQKTSIPSFEGLLTSNDEKTKWMIAYNSELQSQGRIRFTKAHELGHYILHRNRQSEFLCSRDDMLDWEPGENIESQADIFASYLLMPLDDFRAQIAERPNLDDLSHCADRFGVSLTAAVLKWLSYTTEKAVVIMSNDGFMNWASSSNAAFKAGAFFKTRKNIISIPSLSFTANESLASKKSGTKIPAKIWFPYADSDSHLIEMRLYSEQYDSTLTLLLLPKYTDFWPPKK